MKYLFLPLIIILAGCSHHIKNSPDITKEYRVFPVGSSSIEIFFDSGANQSAQSLWSSGSVVVNGSYFGLTNSGEYYPAGLWIEGRERMREIDYTDPNLDIIVVESEGKWQFLNHDGFRKAFPPSGYTRGFQAGPLVVNEGIVHGSYSGSWHADEPHERTMMGVTHGGQVYFFIFREKISIKDAGEKIMQNPRFKNTDIDVVNLDGGPSTSYYDGKQGFREDEKLPILVKIKE